MDVSRTEPKVLALLALMRNAHLSAAHVQSAMITICKRHDATGRAARRVRDFRLGIDSVANDLGWDPDVLLNEVIVQLYRDHAAPENGCSITDKRQ